MTAIAAPTQFVAVPEDSPTQLTYAARVDPAPLTASSSDHPQRASLEIVITNQTDEPVAMQSVGFSFDVGVVGDLGAPLMPSTADLKYAVSAGEWALTGPPPHPVIDHGPVTIAIVPKVGHAFTIAPGGSAVVQIFDFLTVAEPSTATVHVKETPPAHAAVQFTSFDVTTFPHGFYFNGLVAMAGKEAVAQVARDQTVTLRWNSSVVATDNQTVLWSSATGGQQRATVSTGGEWVSPALKSDTVFVVVVSAHAAEGLLTAALATEVAVFQPDITAHTVTAGGLSTTGTVSGGTVSGATVNAGTLNAAAATMSGDAGGFPLAVTGKGTLTSALIHNYGGGVAVVGLNNSGTQPAGLFQNLIAGAGGGVVSRVAGGAADFGFNTNGRYGSSSGHAPLTHLETSNGHRVVTSPLSLEPEVQVSGSAALSGGRAVIELSPEVADMVHHSDGHPYRVLITPAAQCNGMAVVSREPGRFVVEELAGGTSDAAFDWLLIARRPESLGANAVAALPDALPTYEEPESP